MHTESTPFPREVRTRAHDTFGASVYRLWNRGEKGCNQCNRCETIHTCRDEGVK